MPPAREPVFQQLRCASRLLQIGQPDHRPLASRVVVARGLAPEPNTSARDTNTQHNISQADLFEDLGQHCRIEVPLDKGRLRRRHGSAVANMSICAIAVMGMTTSAAVSPAPRASRISSICAPTTTSEPS